MSGIKSQHSLQFERLVHERRELLRDALTAGTPADYPAYRQLVGQLQGLDDALKISEAADYNLSGAEPDAGA